VASRGREREEEELLVLVDDDDDSDDALSNEDSFKDLIRNHK
jgi:predicted GIY-YIG superfamily endonuclease